MAGTSAGANAGAFVSELAASAGVSFDANAPPVHFEAGNFLVGGA